MTVPFVAKAALCFVVFITWIYQKIRHGNEEFTLEDFGKEFYIKEYDDGLIKAFRVDDSKSKVLTYNVPETNNNIITHATYIVDKTEDGKVTLTLNWRNPPRS